MQYKGFYYQKQQFQKQDGNKVISTINIQQILNGQKRDENNHQQSKFIQEKLKTSLQEIFNLGQINSEEEITDMFDIDGISSVTTTPIIANFQTYQKPDPSVNTPPNYISFPQNKENESIPPLQLLEHILEAYSQNLFQFLNRETTEQTPTEPYTIQSQLQKIVSFYQRYRLQLQQTCTVFLQFNVATDEIRSRFSQKIISMFTVNNQQIINNNVKSQQKSPAKYYNLKDKLTQLILHSIMLRMIGKYDLVDNDLTRQAYSVLVSIKCQNQLNDQLTTIIKEYYTQLFANVVNHQQQEIQTNLEFQIQQTAANLPLDQFIDDIFNKSCQLIEIIVYCLQQNPGYYSKLYIQQITFLELQQNIEPLIQKDQNIVIINNCVIDQMKQYMLSTNMVQILCQQIDNDLVDLNQIFKLFQNLLRCQKYNNDICDNFVINLFTQLVYKTIQQKINNQINFIKLINYYQLFCNQFSTIKQHFQSQLRIIYRQLGVSKQIRIFFFELQEIYLTINYYIENQYKFDNQQFIFNKRLNNLIKYLIKMQLISDLSNIKQFKQSVQLLIDITLEIYLLNVQEEETLNDLLRSFLFQFLRFNNIYFNQSDDKQSIQYLECVLKEQYNYSLIDEVLMSSLKKLQQYNSFEQLIFSEEWLQLMFDNDDEQIEQQVTDIKLQNIIKTQDAQIFLLKLRKAQCVCQNNNQKIVLEWFGYCTKDINIQEIQQDLENYLQKCGHQSYLILGDFEYDNADDDNELYEKFEQLLIPSNSLTESRIQSNYENTLQPVIDNQEKPVQTGDDQTQVQIIQAAIVKEVKIQKRIKLNILKDWALCQPSYCDFNEQFIVDQIQKLIETQIISLQDGFCCWED